MMEPYIIAIVFFVIVLFAALLFLPSLIPRFDMPKASLPLQNRSVAQPVNGTPAPAPNATLPSNETANMTDHYWGLITESNVESLCLDEAKAQAGSNSWAVLDCGCTESVTPDKKTYGCNVSAMDGMHPFSAECTRSADSCVLRSIEAGDFSYSFEELARMLGVG
ncbi:Uncharacterised protein [uncultured archaeon]|nr:Uncharacterised protein [uncultured archaeon]